MARPYRGRSWPAPASTPESASRLPAPPVPIDAGARAPLRVHSPRRQRCRLFGGSKWTIGAGSSATEGAGGPARWPCLDPRRPPRPVTWTLRGPREPGPANPRSQRRAIPRREPGCRHRRRRSRSHRVCQPEGQRGVRLVARGAPRRADRTPRAIAPRRPPRRAPGRVSPPSVAPPDGQRAGADRSPPRWHRVPGRDQPRSDAIAARSPRVRHVVDITARTNLAGATRARIRGAQAPHRRAGAARTGDGPPRPDGRAARVVPVARRGVRGDRAGSRSRSSRAMPARCMPWRQSGSGGRGRGRPGEVRPRTRTCSLRPIAGRCGAAGSTWSTTGTRSSRCPHVEEPIGRACCASRSSPRPRRSGCSTSRSAAGQRARREPAVLEDRERLVETLGKQLALALGNIRLRATLRDQSARDALTGLFNRRYMEESLDREVRRAAREGYGLGVLLADLDNFKQLNDAFGHAAGDAVLRRIGRFLRGSRPGRGYRLPLRRRGVRADPAKGIAR